MPSAPSCRRLFRTALAAGIVLLLIDLWSYCLPTVWTGVGIGGGLDGGTFAVEWWDPADSELASWREPGWIFGHNDFAMFGWFGWRDYPSYHVIEIRLLIPLAGAAAATGALALLGFLTARRHRPGLCPFCRYDLRGLPSIDGATACPECGTATHGLTTGRPAADQRG